MDLSYIINHLGENRDEYYNAITPPIAQTSNFMFKTVADFRKAFEDEKQVHLYSRGNNPTKKIVEQKIAALEGTEDCLLTSSGVAAISTAIISQLKAGDHVICVEHCYSWTYHLFTEILPRFNVECTFIDGTEVKNFANALRSNTTMFFLESPTTMYFGLQDLEAVCALAKQHGIITLIDNSYASPLGQQPHQYGVDIVLHTATKYLNGHSDVVAGAICSSKAIIEKIFHHEYLSLGSALSPMNAWLMLRALRTLPLRIRQSSESAQRVIAFLQQHPKTDRIYYPFLPSHPQYALAQKQMKIPMGLFSVEFKCNEVKKMEAFAERLKYFMMAVSWGGHESLVIPAVAFKQPNDYSTGFVRFYIGLEEADVLINDLQQALEVL